MFIHPEKATKFEEISLLDLTLILSNFKTKRKTFQIFVAFSENLDFKVKSHFIKISIVGVMELFLYKNRCYFVWKKKNINAKDTIANCSLSGLS